MKKRFAAIAALLVMQPLVALAHPSAEHRIGVLTDAIQAEPKDQALYIRRGQAYSNEGLLELALADLHKAQTLGDPVAAAFNLGVVYYQLGRRDEARRSFDLFLARSPNHPATLQYRARVARDSGDHAAALADFNAYFALQKNPNPGDYVSAAQMIETLETGGVEAALGILDDGLARLGVIPQLQQPAIQLEAKRGNFAAALARHGTLEAMLGASPDWKVDRAELLLRSGRREEAEQQLRAAGSQLEGLRVTEARRALKGRLDALLASAASNSPPQTADAASGAQPPTTGAAAD